MLDVTDWIYITLILGTFFIFGAFIAGIVCFSIALINFIAALTN